MQVKEKEPDPEVCSVCEPLIKFRPWQKSIVVAASAGEQGTAYQEGIKGLSCPRALGVNRTLRVVQVKAPAGSLQTMGLNPVYNDRQQ